jgi:hypothetical protein
MFQHFDILRKRVRNYPLYRTIGSQLTVRFKQPSIATTSSADPINPINHFMNSLNELFAYALQNVAPNDMVGISIRNEENQTDKAIELSFRRKDQISGDVVWSVFEKVTQSNARFNVLDKLVIDIHSVAMPVGFGRLKTMGRPVDELINRKTSIILVKADENCLAHAIVIAIARINKDPDYKLFIQGAKKNSSTRTTAASRYKN